LNFTSADVFIYPGPASLKTSLQILGQFFSLHFGGQRSKSRWFLTLKLLAIKYFWWPIFGILWTDYRVSLVVLPP